VVVNLTIFSIKIKHFTGVLITGSLNMLLKQYLNELVKVGIGWVSTLGKFLQTLQVINKLQH